MARKTPLERNYQHDLIETIYAHLPGCVIIKTDPEYLQGFPDLLIMHGGRWAALEVKASETSALQPNQTYYVRMLDRMSFASFISPEVEGVVLDQLYKALEPRRASRAAKSK